jgi:mannose-6-phosphate isomerase-like protein (cupin superfamily)
MCVIMTEEDNIEPAGTNPITAFRYRTPELAEGQVKAVVSITKTRLLAAGVQLVRNGGETVLHSHNTEDEIWYVLAGHAAFYGKDNERVEVSRDDGVIIEVAVPYWFEALGDEPLEILRVAAKDPAVKPRYSDPVPAGRAPAVLLDADALEVVRQ